MFMSINKNFQLVVEMTNITKHFGPVIANSDIDFSVRKGEIHCLVGENGAGKTTLMNILYGLVQPDEGQIKVMGKLVDIRNPLDARNLGIGMVHQHFMLVGSYTAAENVVLGNEPTKRTIFDQKKAIKITKELSAKFGLEVNPKAIVEDLPVGVRQRVEIIKTLYRGSEIIIMDEPTAVLTPQESRDLFGTIKTLVNDGKTIIFITHKLKEVMAVADRVTVLRHGKVEGVLNRSEVNENIISRLMVGRDVLFDVKKSLPVLGNTSLRLENVNIRDERNVLSVKNVSFLCHKGEIVTIAGVEGNGQTELIEGITGLRPIESGDLIINGKVATNKSPFEIRQLGLSHIPSDRLRMGLCTEETLQQNLIAGRHNKPPYSKDGIMRFESINQFATDVINKFDIRADSPDVLTSTLSGGNMQKVILARELSFNSELLIASSPTRGVDVGAIESIHRFLINARDENHAVLVVSTDLEEVFQISDRILVMYNGEIAGEFDPKVTTREELGLYMIGARHQQNN
jgi:simple sugar transport system ATP-binding protein